MSDVEPTFRWFSDPLVTRYLPLAGKGNLPLHDIRAYLARSIATERPNLSVILESTDGQPIGCGGFRNFVERESAEISLVIGETSFWGQGIGQEAMTLLLNFGFTELRLVHIWLIVRVDNKRAIDLFSGLGFTRNEILNNSVDVEGVPCDKWRMALDKNAWIPKA